MVEGKRRIVQMELLKPLRYFLELVCGHRINAAEHRGVNILKAFKRLVRAKLRSCKRITDFDFARILDRTYDISYLPGLKLLHRLFVGRENPDLMNRRLNAASDESNILPRLERAVHHTHIRNNAAKFIKHGVENKSS